MSGSHATSVASPFRQPKAVFAVAFACVVSFMGIGLVDPILPAISNQLHASPSEVTLLFTSYLVVTAVMMLVTGWVSSRIGAKRTLVGLQTSAGDIARHGASVSTHGRAVGSVTSGTHSFFLGHPIALAMVEVASLRVGETAAVDVRGREASAEVVQLPFYRGSARSAAAPAKS